MLQKYQEPIFLELIDSFVLVYMQVWQIQESFCNYF